VLWGLLVFQFLLAENAQMIARFAMAACQLLHARNVLCMLQSLIGCLALQLAMHQLIPTLCFYKLSQLCKSA
jgi:hypothetical protein